MLRRPVLSAGVAAGVVVALAAAASGSARPGPGAAGARGAGRAGPSVTGAQALTWSSVPSPNRGTGNNLLDGVSCISAIACTAVGYSTASSGALRTLVESWDGTHWSVVPSLSVGTGGNDLYGVSCVSATACAAAGFYHIAGRNIQKTLTESWDGTSWSVVPSPNPGNPHAFLEGVSCVSATVCTAAGLSNTNSGASTTLIESWDGTNWSVVPSPNPAAESGLDGVSCVSATACTAVGRGLIRGVSNTLIESGTASG